MTEPILTQEQIDAAFAADRELDEHDAATQAIAARARRRQRKLAAAHLAQRPDDPIGFVQGTGLPLRPRQLRRWIEAIARRLTGEGCHAKLRSRDWALLRQLDAVNPGQTPESDPLKPIDHAKEVPA